MNTTHTNIKASLEASKNVVHEVNTEKAKSMFTCRHNNARKNHATKTTFKNKATLENVTNSKYIKLTFTQKVKAD
jgi:hypothetical protein